MKRIANNGDWGEAIRDRRFARGLIGLATVWVLAGSVVSAQDEPVVTIHGASTQEIPYDPPNESHVKLRLSITDGKPNGDGRDLMKGVKIQQFSLAGGKPQMVAEAPECLYDPKKKEYSSTGPLQVHAQGNRFFVSGTGFLFRQNDSSLVISNDAHSIIQNESGTNTVDIVSQRARFEMKADATNGTAVYEGNVRVNQPQMQMTSDYLYANLPRGAGSNTNRPDRIVAETNVVIDFQSEKGERTHAIAEKAVYNFKSEGGLTNEVLELTGNPRVTLTNGWMTADLLVMDRATGSLQGQDNFHFHYLPATPEGTVRTNAADEADIYSDRFDYNLNTRVARFGSVWSHVRVRDPRLKLDSESLITTLPQSGTGQSDHLDHIVAEKDVTIDLPDEKTGRNIHATGQKAVYDNKVVDGITNEVLELTGDPAVEAVKPVARFTADVIRLDRGLGKIWSSGHQHSVLKKQPDEPATMDTEVFSEWFESVMGTGLSVYTENVRAYDPEMNLTSDRLTIKTIKGENGQSNRLDNIVAEGNVAIDFAEKAFAPGDITNLTSFAARLKQPGDFDAVGQFVSGQLTPPTRELLAGYEGGTNALLQTTLATELNRLTKSGHVYETNRFSRIELEPDTKKLLAQNPMGIDLVELNRLLLLDAFRGQLARTEQGEKTHATGDRAMYAYVPMGATTNAVLVLTGHPRLDKPDWWVTTEDAIDYDQTTGESHFVGKPHSQLKFGGFTGIKPPPLGKKAKP